MSCRNLLIYLNRAAQDRVLECSTSRCDPDGYLFLGSSESVEGSSDLFAAVDKDAHIYQSRGVAPCDSRLRLPPVPRLAVAATAACARAAPRSARANA